MGIQVKRVSQIARPEDGIRILVDRYWPRGVPESSDAVTTWIRELSPSPESIAWYGHKAERWDGFKERYWAELDKPEKSAHLRSVRHQAETGTVTLVYGARHAERNTALALFEYLVRGGLITNTPPAASSYQAATPAKNQAWPLLPGRETLQWATLGMTVFLPLSGLLVIQAGLAYGLRGWLVMGAVFSAFVASTLVRVQREETFRAELNDAIPRDRSERESGWLVVRAILASLAQTAVALAIIGLVFLFLLGASGYVA